MKNNQTSFDSAITHARELTNQGKSTDAISLLYEILHEVEDHAEANYLLAFNLHVYQKNYQKAVEHYRRALKSGFDEFWVRYNLGSLFCIMQSYQEACTELEQAVRLNNDHAGARQVLRKAKALLSKESETNRSNGLALNRKLAKKAEVIQHSMLVSNGSIDHYELFIPQSLKKYQPLNPLNFEDELFQGLKLVVKTGTVVFEAGSYCGVLTTIIAKMVGEKGQVHVFEASFDSMERAKLMAGHNHVSQVSFQNVFLTEESGCEQDFYAIRSGEGWAVSSADAGIKQLYPEAEKIRVASLAMDDYVDRTGIVPDVIKMDIEGAEYAALLGAKKLLKKHTPDIILEVHGDRMPGILGSMTELMDFLADFGYHFLDLETGSYMTSQEYSAAYPIYGHVLCIRQPLEKSIMDDFSGSLPHEQERREIYLENRKEARKLVDGAHFSHALEMLDQLLKSHPDDAELLYLKAFCEHSIGQNIEQALAGYQKALENGFDEFWVRYQRGNLYYQIAETEQALSDINAALRLNPTHEGARNLLASILAASAEK